MVQHLSDQDPAPKDLSSLVNPVPDFSQSINSSYVTLKIVCGINTGKIG